MLISSDSINTIARKLSEGGSSVEIFCSGLFLSARWFAVSQLDHDGLQVIVLPDRETAEYCAHKGCEVSIVEMAEKIANGEL